MTLLYLYISYNWKSVYKQWINNIFKPCCLSKKKKKKRSSDTELGHGLDYQTPQWIITLHALWSERFCSLGYSCCGVHSMRLFTAQSLCAGCPLLERLAPRWDKETDCFLFFLLKNDNNRCLLHFQITLYIMYVDDVCDLSIWVNDRLKVLNVQQEEKNKALMVTNVTFSTFYFSSSVKSDNVWCTKQKVCIHLSYTQLRVMLCFLLPN